MRFERHHTNILCKFTSSPVFLFVNSWLEIYDLAFLIVATKRAISLIGSRHDISLVASHLALLLSLLSPLT